MVRNTTDARTEVELDMEILCCIPPYPACKPLAGIAEVCKTKVNTVKKHLPWLKNFGVVVTKDSPVRVYIKRSSWPLAKLAAERYWEERYESQP